MNSIFSNLVQFKKAFSSIVTTFSGTTAELCVFQAIMLCLTIALVMYLCKVAKKKAIVIDRKLQDGSYWKLVLYIGLALILGLSVIVWLHHTIKCGVHTDLVKDDSYSAFQDVSQYFFGVNVAIADIKGEYISSMLVGLIKVFFNPTHSG